MYSAAVIVIFSRLLDIKCHRMKTKHKKTKQCANSQGAKGKFPLPPSPRIDLNDLARSDKMQKRHLLGRVCSIRWCQVCDGDISVQMMRKCRYQISFIVFDFIEAVWVGGDVTLVGLME